jgi:hypothetical protein
MVSPHSREHTRGLLFQQPRSATPPRGGTAVCSQSRVGSRSSATFSSPHLGGLHVDDS